MEISLQIPYIIIIIINFYSDYILRNLGSETQQKESLSIIMNRDGYLKVIIRTMDHQRFMVEMQFGINVFFNSFFRNIAVVSDVFKVMGSSFQTQGTAREKSCLPMLNLVLGTIGCCEMNDLSCLGIFDRYRRLAM